VISYSLILSAALFPHLRDSLASLGHYTETSKLTLGSKSESAMCERGGQLNLLHRNCLVSRGNSWAVGILPASALLFFIIAKACSMASATCHAHHLPSTEIVTVPSHSAWDGKGSKRVGGRSRDKQEKLRARGKAARELLDVRKMRSEGYGATWCMKCWTSGSRANFRKAGWRVHTKAGPNDLQTLKQCTRCLIDLDLTSSSSMSSSCLDSA